ncbi:hypothetical protein Kisp02_41720 [Kineosporia sp. NBRC 101731]|nr:hypothetical protein Kisp02_41720 [Kineosporia sp. NBRC 101731]
MVIFRPALQLRRRALLVGGSLVLAAGAILVSSQASTAAVTADDCDLSEEETITVEDLPEGSSAIECEAVGLVLRSGDVGVTVPAPGEAAGVEALSEDGIQGFQIEVAADGTVTYPEETPGTEDSDEFSTAAVGP